MAWGTGEGDGVATCTGVLRAVGPEGGAASNAGSV
jgi:hypothetical protein